MFINQNLKKKIVSTWKLYDNLETLLLAVGIKNGYFVTN